MTKYFAEMKTVEELRKRYRELLRKYHPDNENGSTEITQRITQEYDALFAILSKEKKSDGNLIPMKKTSVLRLFRMKL